MADWAIVKVDLVQAKDINLSYDTSDLGIDVDLSGKQLDMRVINSIGTVIKTWSSAGVSPVITIVGSSINILDTAGFADWGFFRGELINNTDDETLAFFEFNVEKQITAVT
jgi:hypothetical protein